MLVVCTLEDVFSSFAAVPEVCRVDGAEGSIDMLLVSVLIDSAEVVSTWLVVLPMAEDVVSAALVASVVRIVETSNDVVSTTDVVSPSGRVLCGGSEAKTGAIQILNVVAKFLLDMFRSFNVVARHVWVLIEYVFSFSITVNGKKIS